jgi:hypothetical protein
MSFTSNNTEGCLSTSEIPYNWDGPIFHAANGACYGFNSDGTVEYYSNYGYNPALGTGITFCIIFGAFMLLHLGLTLKSKRWWCIVTVVGALVELFGWIGRAMSGHDNSGDQAAGNSFLLQIVCLTIAPAFFSATIYGLFVLIVDRVAPTGSRFNPRKLTYFFVGCDITSLVLQAAGGGMASGATTVSANKQGTHIMVAGIAFQLCAMIVFSGIGLDYLLACRKAGVPAPPRGLRCCIGGVVVASVMVIIRGIYRTAELAQGWNGYLITHEAYFLGLDAVPMVVCLAALAAAHPMFTVTGEPGRQGHHAEKLMGRVDSEATAGMVQQGAAASKGEIPM